MTQYAFLGLLSVLPPEWRASVKTLIHDYTDAPLVTSAIIFEPLDHLRSHVLAGTYHRVGSRSCSTSIPPVNKVLEVPIFGLALPFMSFETCHQILSPLQLCMNVATFLLIRLISVNVDA